MSPVTPTKRFDPCGKGHAIEPLLAMTNYANYTTGQPPQPTKNLRVIGWRCWRCGVVLA